MSGEGPAVLNQINLVVRDMEATLAFYRRLGLDIPEAQMWRTETGVHHVTARMPNGVDLEFDSAQLARSYNAGWRPQPASGSRVLLGFSLASRDAVDAKYEALVAAGYTGSQPPWDAFWGARHAIVDDPDGNHVGLMSPVDPARRGPPPAV